MSRSPKLEHIAAKWLLGEAITRGATSLHFEPGCDGRSQVRARIDGVLVPMVDDAVHTAHARTLIKWWKTRSLREGALLLAEAGVTSMVEALRVTPLAPRGPAQENAGA